MRRYLLLTPSVASLLAVCSTAICQIVEDFKYGGLPVCNYQSVSLLELLRARRRYARLASQVEVD